MNITPIYELKARLRAGMIAGSNLLSEDFRLKKAVEGFAPLEKSAPVFTKIGEMTKKLLRDSTPENLLDTITLVDAVITTLGTTDVKGDVEDLPDGFSAEILDIPYSKLKTLIDALTTLGSGHFNTVFNNLRESPEIFRDYRVLEVLVLGLGAKYSELADLAEKIVIDVGKAAVPFLKRGFDPKGKKESVRRLRAVNAIAGAEENDFYLEQLGESEGEVRKCVIGILCRDERNVDTLIELAKTEKGKLKNAAMSGIAMLDCEKSAEFYREFAVKNPAKALEFITPASSRWTSELTAELFDRLLADENGGKVTLNEALTPDKDGREMTLKAKIYARDMAPCLFGKLGAKIEEIYRGVTADAGLPRLSGALGGTIVVTNDESLKGLATELNNAPATRDKFIFAEAVTLLLGDEDCSKWVEKHVKEVFAKDKDPNYHVNTPIMKALDSIELKNGEYVITTEKLNPATDEYMYFDSAPLKQPIKGAFTDILMKYPSSHYNTLFRWADSSDREYTEKLAYYYVDRSIKEGKLITAIFYNLWGIKAENIKGLPLRICKDYPDLAPFGDLDEFFTLLPGDEDYKREEARAVIEAVRGGKLKLKISKEEFESWAAGYK